jgi:hypothetical protein
MITPPVFSFQCAGRTLAMGPDHCLGAPHGVAMAGGTINALLIMGFDFSLNEREVLLWNAVGLGVLSLTADGLRLALCPILHERIAALFGAHQSDDPFAVGGLIGAGLPYRARWWPP